MYSDYQIHKISLGAFWDHYLNCQNNYPNNIIRDSSEVISGISYGVKFFMHFREFLNLEP